MAYECVVCCGARGRLRNVRTEAYKILKYIFSPSPWILSCFGGLLDLSVGGYGLCEVVIEIIKDMDCESTSVLQEPVLLQCGSSL
ncbi:hypothetical protein A2U01_0006006 [Trifolium medium]|uniref:Uncharacterized protein n=1 Tax=Trifolium medium TaxID=97028 RepID=A0A392MCD4_9FABA|nr:hypothetical protein [Trifolium medium]